MKTKHTILSAALAMAVLAAPAEDASADSFGEAEADAALEKAALLAMYADWAGEMRRTAIDDAAALAPFFSETAFAEGGRRTCEELGGVQLADFFTGAQVLPGVLGRKGAVLAFWNPFWDALLFVLAKDGELPLPGSDAEPVPPKVDSFAWTSGESFRREENEGELPRTDTVVPTETTPLAVSLWRVQKETIARFDALYPGDGLEMLLLRTGVDKSGSETDWKRIRARSALRLRMAPMLASNRTDYAVAAQCTGLLRGGELWRLRDHFRDPAHDLFCRSLAKLPPELRSEFELYGYVPTPEGTLFYFVERGIPRLFATVSVPAGRIPHDGEAPVPARDRAKKGELSMEWYDLDKAAELLLAWEEEKSNGGAR